MAAGDDATVATEEDSAPRLLLMLLLLGRCLSRIQSFTWRQFVMTCLYRTDIIMYTSSIYYITKLNMLL